MSLAKIIFGILCSQIYILGVFSASGLTHYVIDYKQNLCGVFTMGNANEANWLISGWEALSRNTVLQEKFDTTLSCAEGNVSGCCRDMGFRYAGVPIGVDSVSLERKAAEFLASKGIIQKYSLAPNNYNLENFLTRREVMKVIINISSLPIQQNCLQIFVDVENDWACKYIETALENDYIVGYQAFRPNDFVTKTEALKLIFKARNIEKRYQTDYWQEDYISTALYLDYIDVKFSDYNTHITRGEIFAIAARTYDEFKTW